MSTGLYYPEPQELFLIIKATFLKPGSSIDIPVKVKHSLGNPYKEELKIIEVQKGNKLVEEDIIRYKDIYGRVKA